MGSIPPIQSPKVIKRRFSLPGPATLCCNSSVTWSTSLHFLALHDRHKKGIKTSGHVGSERKAALLAGSIHTRVTRQFLYTTERNFSSFFNIYIWVSVHHKSIINQQDATLAVSCLLTTTSMLYMFRTPFASIIRSTKNCNSSHWCLSWIGME